MLTTMIFRKRRGLGAVDDWASFQASSSSRLGAWRERSLKLIALCNSAEPEGVEAVF